MMIRRLLLGAAALLAASCAPSTDAQSGAPPNAQAPQAGSGAGGGAEDAATPVWRADLSHLGDDGAALQSCFASADQHNDSNETPCLRVVQDACLAALGQDAGATTAGARGCAWRAIAAWEQVLERTADDLRATLSEPARGEFEASQVAWETFLLADVRAQSAPYEGGALQGVVAAEVRARSVAERAIELRAFRRSLEP